MDLSIIVVVYDMAREIPRTLQSLSRAYQEHCEDLSYEVLVIDNGSPNPVDESVITAVGPEFRHITPDQEFQCSNYFSMSFNISRTISSNDNATSIVRAFVGSSSTSN